MVINLNTYQYKTIKKVERVELISSICGIGYFNFAWSLLEYYNCIINIWKVTENNYERIYEEISGCPHNDDGYYKIIELEDGNLCACSSSGVIYIFDSSNDYECVRRLEHQGNFLTNIIEINNYIKSAG